MPLSVSLEVKKLFSFFFLFLKNSIFLIKACYVGNGKSTCCVIHWRCWIVDVSSAVGVRVYEIFFVSRPTLSFVYRCFKRLFCYLCVDDIYDYFRRLEKVIFLLFFILFFCKILIIYIWKRFAQQAAERAEKPEDTTLLINTSIQETTHDEDDDGVPRKFVTV